MARLTTPQLTSIARQHYDAGRLADAEGLCRRILSDDPVCPMALHLSGLIARQLGRHDAGVGFFRRATAAAPLNATFHADLGRACRQSGQLPEAISAFRQSVQLDPESFDALSDLAGVHHAQGELDEAVDAYQRALRQRPGAVAVLLRLGDALRCLNRLDEAIAAYRETLARSPNDAPILLKLGATLHQAGRLDEAAAEFRAALVIDPRSAEGHRRLGEIQRQAGQLDQAVESFQRAVELEPLDPAAQVSLGNILLSGGLLERAAGAYCQAIMLKPLDRDVCDSIGAGVEDELQVDAAITRCAQLLGQRTKDATLCFNAASAFQRRRFIDAAIIAYERALEIEPDHVAALNNLSLALKDEGRLDESIQCSTRAVSSHPQVSACHGNLLYSLHFHPDSNAASLHAEHARWAARHAEPLRAWHRPHDNARSPDRRLRIGYVSPNFNVHPVGRFLSPLLACHDHERFEVVCYSSVRRPDALTTRFREQADRWIDTLLLSDEALADQIRIDEIDILVDLTMHMADSRLLTFARKPAPVQVTYLAYCSTTGVDAIDYRITDPLLDPPGRDDRHYAERSIRLPLTYWCYEPVIVAPEVNTLPALSNGHVTFASLNNFCKASPAALALWARVMHAVPGSHLIIHALRGGHREQTRQRFAAAGIDPQRLRFFDLLTLPDYFKLHHEIDLSLDSFPYPGGTTTCDALWMGVPTVSLVGDPAFTRSGLSILTHAGFPELAADTEEHYLETAVKLAGDSPRLAGMRAALREQMRSSPLMNAPRFAEGIESIYRSIWRKWCTQSRP